VTRQESTDTSRLVVPQSGGLLSAYAVTFRKYDAVLAKFTSRFGGRTLEGISV
jgi:hypothetical protein